MSELKAIVEALIFASPEPMTMKSLVRLLDEQSEPLGLSLTGERRPLPAYR